MTRTLAVWLPGSPSRALDDALHKVARDIAPSPSRATVAEAERRARYLRRELDRREPAIAAAWLAELSRLVANHPSAEAFADQVPSRIAALDLPPLAYTRETLAEAARRCRYWPSVAEVAEILFPVVNKVTREAIACERIARSREPEPRQPPTPEEIERVTALAAEAKRQLAAITAEREAREAARRAALRPPREPKPVAREALIAGYHAAGLPLPPWLADRPESAECPGAQPQSPNTSINSLRGHDASDADR